MRIKYKSTSCGPQGSFQPGDERETDEQEGGALVQGGYAEDITPREVREQTIASAAPEQAVSMAQPRPRRTR